MLKLHKFLQKDFVLDEQYEKMVDMAREAVKNAYAPYSGFRVGAAILTCSGTIYPGFNVENSSYGGTICAERTACLNAILNGEREFKAIAIAVNSEEFTPPCGICRQFISEFSEDVDIILVNSEGKAARTDLKTLFPMSFRL